MTTHEQTTYALSEEMQSLVYWSSSIIHQQMQILTQSVRPMTRCVDTTLCHVMARLK